jgi:hypothetical protein
MKLRYFRKGDAYFRSTRNRPDADQEYIADEEIQEWNNQCYDRNQADKRALEEQNISNPTFEETVRSIIHQMIEEGTIKEGPNYND